MRIAKFALDGNGAWPDLRSTALDDGLTLFVGQSNSGKSTVVRFIGHVLYGRQPLRHTLPNAASTLPPEGELVVDVSEGNYRLRRYNDVSPPGRLTVSSLSGVSADQHTVHKLLSGVSPSILSQLYIASFNNENGENQNGLRQLLSEDFANGFQLPCIGQTSTLNHGGAEQRSVDTLAILNRRDEIARELEARLSSDRRHSAELKNQLQDLSSQRNQRRQEIDAISLRLRAVESSLAEIEARLRYDQVEATVNHEQAQAIPVDLEAKLADVDNQIDLWRTTLSDLERRESQVRDRLTQIHPNDAAARLPLADQRTHLGVVRRLLSDLEGEVSRLAQASGSNRCVCSDAHPRFLPIVDTLSKHLSLLDDSLNDQEQTVEYQDLLAEAEHIGRSRHELRQQLEHLLQRRQTLLRSGRPTRHSTRRDANDRSLLDSPNAIHGYDIEQLESERTRLAHERADLKSHYETATHGLNELESRYQDLSHNRANLLSGDSIDTLRSELTALERQLQHSSSPSASSRDHHPLEDTVRASDFLARLSSGRFTRIELSHGGRSAQVTTQQGTETELESLSSGDCVLVHLSLVLSLVSAHARRGIHLPLILDEPFAQLSSQCRSAVCNVLNEFVQSGHQVLLFTRDTEAASHFRHVGRSVIDMQQLRCASDADVELKSELRSEFRSELNRELRSSRTTTTDLVHEHTPIQTATQTVSVAEQATSPFHLQLDCSIGDFPALGRETKEAFGDIGIQTVGDLVDAEPETVAKRLGRSEIDTEIVRLWQTHLLLMCFVPGVSLSDAQILSGAGIESPDELEELSTEQIWLRVSDYLATDRGERFRSRGYRIDREAAAAWIAGVRQHRQRWTNSRHASRWRERRSRWASSRSTSKRPTRSTRSSSRSRTRERSQRSSTRSQSTRVETRSESSRSRLRTSSPVVDAPSIGPKTADRLAAVEITTIAELLSADPESTAAELDVRHIKVSTIKAWQHQARLSLAMPKLLSRDAQVLVGCGFKSCQQISIMSASDLYSVIVPFCQSKEGERILRDGDPPTQERVAEWIEWAGQTNQIEAA